MLRLGFWRYKGAGGGVDLKGPFAFWGLHLVILQTGDI